MKPSRAKTLLLTLTFAAASNMLIAQVPPPPDLHAGGASPSAIPNNDTTEVSLPGLHLTGTTVTVSGVCTLASSQVVSDTEIRMKLTGNRTLDDKDDSCFLQVHQGEKQASTYVVVNLSGAEQQQLDARQAATAKTKSDNYMATLGTRWTLHYADGKSEVLTVQPSEPGQLPDFNSNRGGTAKVMINGGNKVMIIANECILSGTITPDNKVEDGKVMAGTCPHPGAWTAQKK
jgi:hypothetical protein